MLISTLVHCTSPCVCTATNTMPSYCYYYCYHPLQLLTEFTTPPQFALFNSPTPKRKRRSNSNNADSTDNTDAAAADAAAAAAAAEKQEPLLNSYKHDGDGSWHMLSLGQSRAGLPIHVHGETWLGLVYGAKRWFLYPPGRR
jgi:hypothetical protein